MPSVSKAQQHLFAAAEHGASFKMASRLRDMLPKSTLHEFAATRTKGLPKHVKPAKRRR